MRLSHFKILFSRSWADLSAILTLDKYGMGEARDTFKTRNRKKCSLLNEIFCSKNIGRSFRSKNIGKSFVARILKCLTLEKQKKKTWIF